jgi:hypothetical protein
MAYLDSWLMMRVPPLLLGVEERPAAAVDIPVTKTTMGIGPT